MSDNALWPRMRGEIMADYSLSIDNQSTNPHWTFAVYTDSPITGPSANRFPLAWLTHNLARGSTVTFTWKLQFALTYATQGCVPGAVWQESGSVNVDDSSAEENSVALSYDTSGQYYSLQLAPNTHRVNPGEVYLDTSATVPPWSQTNGPSVGLSILGGISGGSQTYRPAIAADSGPNLGHVFDLHPTYFIQASNVAQGTMVTLNTLSGLQKVVYPKGTTKSEWIFEEDNKFHPKQ
jgi:hypothetical protein